MEKEIVTTTKQDPAAREVEVNIAPLLSAIVRKIWLIILGVVIGGLLFQGATRVFVKPTYLSSFTAFVNNQTQNNGQKSAVSQADIQASRELVATYSRILTSNNVLVASAEFINLDMSYDQLSRCVSTQVVDNTQVIRVNVITNNAHLSYRLAQAIANTAPTYMSQIVEGSSMKIVDAPRAPKDKYGPNYAMSSVLGALVGAVIALIYILVKYFKDDSIKSEGDLEGRYGMPVIGVIPNLTESRGFGYYQNDYYSDYYVKSEEMKKQQTKDKKNRKKKGDSDNV